MVFDMNTPRQIWLKYTLLQLFQIGGIISNYFNEEITHK